MASKKRTNKGTSNLHDAIAEELVGAEETVPSPLVTDAPVLAEAFGKSDGAPDRGADTRMIPFSPDMQRAVDAGVKGGVDKLQPIPEALQAQLDFGDKQVPLTKPLMIIGRVTEVSDIPLPEDDQVSRAHAAVTYSNGAFFIEDLESTNGTFVDGKRSTREELKPGVVIRVGLSTFTLSVNVAAQKPAKKKKA